MDSDVDALLTIAERCERGRAPRQSAIAALLERPQGLVQFALTPPQTRLSLGRCEALFAPRALPVDRTFQIQVLDPYGYGAP